MIKLPYRLSNIIPNQVGVGDFVVERFDFSIAEITNIFSTPIVISKGFTTGYLQVPEWFMLIRQGSPYATQPGSIIIRCVTSSPIQWMASGTQTLTASLLPGSNAFWGNCLNANVGAGDELPTAAGGKNIDVTAVAGNPTVDGTRPGSPVSIFLCYKIIPIYEQNWLSQDRG